MNFIRLREIFSAKGAWPKIAGQPISKVERLLWWAKLGWVNNLRLKTVGPAVLAVSLVLWLISGYWLLVWLMGLALGIWLIRRKAGQERKKFVKQLPDGLQSLADTLRAGYSLPQAIAFIAEELAEPLCHAFKALKRANEFSVNFSGALLKVGEDLGVGEWTMTAQMLIAEQKLGGNFLPLLDDLIKTLRDRLHSAEEIKTLTAAGRTSGYLIAGLVPVILLFFFVVSPGYLAMFFNTAIGRLLFLFAFLLELAGFVWIKKIVYVDY